MFLNRDPSASKTARVRAIKDWTRQAMSLPDGIVIMVTELQCTEPGCPPLETVIAIMGEGGTTRQLKIHRPALEVTVEDVEESVARLLRGQAHEHPPAPDERP